MRQYFLLVVLGISAVAFCADGMGPEPISPRPQQRETRERSSARMDRLNEQKAKAAQLFSKVKANLAIVLTAVSQNQKLDDQTLTQMNKDFMAVRRDFRILDRSQQSDVMLLDAWIVFMQSGDAMQALKRSERSCMLHPVSGDAYSSSVVFSILAGKEPKSKEMVLRLAKKNRNSDEPVMSSSVIDVQVPEFSRILVGRDIPMINPEEKIVDGAYSCILLWTLDPEPINSEDFEKLKAVKDQLPQDKRAVVEELLSKPSVTPEYVKQQVVAFSSLSENNTTEDKVAFFSINVDQEDELAEFLKSNTPSPMPISGTQLPALTGDITEALKMAGALLLVIDKDNSVKYAGATEGFLPIMLLNNLVPGSQKEREIDSKAVAAKASTHDMGMLGMGMPPVPPVDKGKDVKVADSNSLPADEVKPEESEKELTDQQRQDNTDELLPEQQAQAEKLLASAKMYRGSHTRLGSSKRVAESCFTVIEKFPGTTYEAQANKILDSIPAHQKKKYGIEE